MIKSGYKPTNESVGRDQASWKQEAPDMWDEGRVEGYIKNFDDAAKAMKCKASELVNITEDDEPDYQKIISKIKSGDKGQRIRMPEIDGHAGIFTLTNGVTIVTTNEWGYGTIFVKKSEVDKAEK